MNVYIQQCINWYFKIKHISINSLKFIYFIKIKQHVWFGKMKIKSKLSFILAIINICLIGEHYSCPNTHKFDVKTYSSLIFSQPKQNEIKPKNLSKSTCFFKQVNFTMGTNEPIFNTDGEGPTRFVMLKPFCIDQTEVSNLQFHQYIKETGYRTDVTRFSFIGTE